MTRISTNFPSSGYVPKNAQNASSSVIASQDGAPFVACALLSELPFNWALKAGGGLWTPILPASGPGWIVCDPRESAWLGTLAGRGSAHRPGSPGCAPVAPAPGPAPARDVAQVRGVLAGRVAISTMLDPFLTLKALVAYSGIGLRKLYEYLADPIHPLPHYRVGGKIVVRRSEFDAWIVAYRRVGGADINALVNDVVASLAR